VGYEKRFNTSLSVAEMGEDVFVEAILAGQPDPQTYFARMKRQNNHGVPLLGPLPSPHRLSIIELEGAIAEGRLLPLDTRLDRAAFMARHLPGSLFAPLNKSFNTVVGSLVEDESTPILLIVADDRVDEAVRDLVRIGYDRIEGYITPETLARYFDRGGMSSAIERITFAKLAELRGGEGVAVVDARFGSEFAAGHIEGAVNASYTRLPSYTRERIPRGKELLVHCSVGARSGPAASYLAREGFRVKFVDGPIGDWK
jgi:hydroxyacylglutathione hydrolase